MGSALSPNGLGFADSSDADMVSLALMDRVLEVDRVSGHARIQVCAVSMLLVTLTPHPASAEPQCAAAGYLGNMQANSQVNMLACWHLLRCHKLRPAAAQAGARIAEVVDALREHGLALQNIASIREQAMGGFVQIRCLQKPVPGLRS